MSRDSQIDFACGRGGGGVEECLFLGETPGKTFFPYIAWVLGRIQDLVTWGSDKRRPSLSNCYCCLTSPFITRKSMVKIFAFVSL